MENRKRASTGLKDVKVKMMDEVIAKYDYNAQDKQELSVKKNEKFTLLDDSKDWWKVVNAHNQHGFVPSNYMKRIKPSLLSKLSNTLGRKKNVDKSYVLHGGARNGDIGAGALNNSLGGVGVESYSCDNVTAKAKYAYAAQQTDELSLTKGEQITVLEKSSDGWWKGQKGGGAIGGGAVGWFPSNYVIEDSAERDLQTPTVFPPLPELKQQTDSEILDVVLTLYPYTASNAEELGFDADENLDIVEKPASDPDWWRARNDRGEVGLVPRNYVQVLDGGTRNATDAATPNSHSNSSNLSSTGSLTNDTSNHHQVAVSASSTVRSQFRLSPSLADKPWYYGNITRAECDIMLGKTALNGDFLIRDSESHAGNYTVTLKAQPKNKHFRVTLQDGSYGIGQQTFDSLDDLVDHYTRHPIYRCDNEKLYLIKPFIHPDDRSST
ncbi:cytoplasmic protein NCK2-like isoform X2 [Tubulanus polymorphus]|uniref:cytoplasmic protein NCK2-like isoform X2 n=1 Tax=Tubulanus polymorphus TaxID=672921 RepID=UPI003DA57642